MSARCTTELVAQGWDSPIDGFSVESDDVPQYSELGYAQPRQPIGQGWGTFGQVALAYSPDSRDAAFAGASFVAMANAMYPVQATAPAQRGRIGYPSDIPPDACPSCTPFEDGCLEGTEVSPTTPQITTIYKNSPQTATADCPAPLEGLPVSYTVPEGAYKSSVSQEDADSQAYDAAIAQAQLLAPSKCCEPPTEITDIVWQQATPTDTPVWSFTTGGDGTYTLNPYYIPEQSTIHLHGDICNSWGTYDVTISVTIDYVPHGYGPHFNGVDITMDEPATSYKNWMDQLNPRTVTKTFTLTPGNHYFEIYAHLCGFGCSFPYTGVIQVRPLNHP